MGYSLGQFINGNLADKLNPRFFYSFGLFITALSYLGIFFMAERGVYNELYYYIVFFFNGYF